MGDRNNPNDGSMTFLFGSIALICLCAYRTLTIGYYGGTNTMAFFDLVIVVLMVVSLTSIRMSKPALFDERHNSSAGFNSVLFWVANTAGIGLILIKFSGQGGWYTGHLMATIPPAIEFR